MFGNFGFFFSFKLNKPKISVPQRVTRYWADVNVTEDAQRQLCSVREFCVCKNKDIILLLYVLSVVFGSEQGRVQG